MAQAIDYRNVFEISPYYVRPSRLKYCALRNCILFVIDLQEINSRLMQSEKEGKMGIIVHVHIKVIKAFFNWSAKNRYMKKDGK